MEYKNMKQCSKCKNILPETEFFWNSIRGKRIRRGDCKECHLRASNGTHKKDGTLKYYVYAHRALDGTVFYIGKGCGNRINIKQHRNPNWEQQASLGYTKEKLFVGMSHDQAMGVERICKKEYAGALTNIL